MISLHVPREGERSYREALAFVLPASTIGRDKGRTEKAYGRRARFGGAVFAFLCQVSMKYFLKGIRQIHQREGSVAGIDARFQEREELLSFPLFTASFLFPY